MFKNSPKSLKILQRVFNYFINALLLHNRMTPPIYFDRTSGRLYIRINIFIVSSNEIRTYNTIIAYVKSERFPVKIPWFTKDVIQSYAVIKQLKY